MAILITGAAGFIGSNIVQRMLESGCTVIGMDNFSSGSERNIRQALRNPKFTFAEIDLSDLPAYQATAGRLHAEQTIEEVWHLAANSDIPKGISDATVDLRDTFLTTFNTLEVMRTLAVKQLAFASSSAIYGDHKNVRLEENAGPLFPISNYGAMKLASEALISAAVTAWLDRAWIFRFPNVVGIPATHGALLDFVRKLKRTPENLDVLGNGTQQKEYLHVSDLIDGMRFIRKHASERLAYFNVGAGDDGVTVRFMAEQVVAAGFPSAAITFGKGDRGWVGDVPRFFYSIEKARALGWQPTLGSAAAVKRAVREILAQEANP